MPTTTKVLASRFNALVTRMNAILGTSNLSTPTFGYGQTTNANTVVGNYNTNTGSTNLIDDAQYRNLYIDMVRARVHQIGSAAFTQSPFPVGSYNINGASTDKVTEAYIIALESLMTSIETDKFLIYEAQQAALEPLKNSGGFNLQGSRTQSAAGTWNQTLSFIFTVTFTSDAARRHFFNSGGQVRLAGQRVAGVSSNAKSTSWTNLLTSVGQVTFAVNRTYSTLAYGSGTSIGNKDLTGTYQQLYEGGSGTYSGNYFRVYALQNSGTQIQFRVYFQDIRSEGVDEPVYGDFNITTQILRPEGTVTISGNSYNTVTITPAPIGTIVTNIIQI
jgi:hypothetical protein